MSLTTPTKIGVWGCFGGFICNPRHGRKYEAVRGVQSTGVSQRARETGRDESSKWPLMREENLEKKGSAAPIV